RLMEDGMLSVDDPIANYLDQEVSDKLTNVEGCKITHLLAHTSGIPDYYTINFELDRFNREDNGFAQEDILAYTYGKPATNAVGETYYYSNTNFLLLAMIAEKATGKAMADLYQQYIFDPLNLESGYYGTGDSRLPKGIAKGYADIYGSGSHAESQFLYQDELGTGDGGLAINAYDLFIFLQALGEGQLLSGESEARMFDWFDLPEDWVWEDLQQIKNGYGVEYFAPKGEPAIGHTGSVDGFLSVALYFPEKDLSVILLTNNASTASGREEIIDAVLDEILP
ncbi:MAG: serine hydrolase domain-containing protein, partial [Bacteroidota bacterium]